jgi:two-component system, chemotaxis family, sensor kinase CheA
MTALNDEELLKEFVAEGREHLSSIEPDLLILERDAENTDQEIINRIFRAIHSIKGASGFFGLQALKSLSHSMENTLMMVRDGKLMPRSDVMDPLLLGVDRLRLMFEDIQSSEEISYQDIVAALEKIMHPSAVTEIVPVTSEAVATADDADTDKAPAASATASGDADPLASLADAQMVEQAMRSGQHLYRMELDLDADFYGKKLTPLEFQSLMASTGVILSSQLDTSDISGLEGCLETTLPWRILYASVLDADLIAATFDLSDSQFEETSYATLFPEIQPKKAALPINPPEALASPASVENAPSTSATEPVTIPEAYGMHITFASCQPRKSA